MRLWYFLRCDLPYFDEMAKEWETAATKYIKRKWSNNSLLEVIFYVIF